MKNIELIKGTGLTTQGIIEAVIKAAPNGVDLAEMRKRDRIFQAVEKLTDDDTVLSLEDADYAVLVGVTSSFKFNQYSPELLAILDGIEKPE